MRLLILIALAVGSSAIAAAKTPDPAHLESENEYGIALALSGQDARAESAFVSLLSHAPGDARALNNIGNVHLLRGDLDVALGFFGRARDGDSTDAGIMLNASTALMLRGDEDEAQALAAKGVEQAGGLKAAALLLGLKAPDATPKAGDRAYIRKEEVLALLRAAAAGVPADTVKAGRDPGTAPADRPRKKKRTAWRSAGVRGAEGTDITAVVYWKQR